MQLIRFIISVTSVDLGFIFKIKPEWPNPYRYESYTFLNFWNMWSFSRSNPSEIFGNWQVYQWETWADRRANTDRSVTVFPQVQIQSSGHLPVAVTESVSSSPLWPYKHSGDWTVFMTHFFFFPSWTSECPLPVTFTYWVFRWKWNKTKQRDSF